MSRLYDDLARLCFAENELPWYSTVYKNILYATVWLHINLVHSDWE